MSRLKQFNASAVDIATRAELKKRLASRPKARAEMHLTPGNRASAAVNRNIGKAQDVRIGHLREQLGKANHNFRRNAQKAFLKDRALRDFDRSR